MEGNEWSTGREQGQGNSKGNDPWNTQDSYYTGRPREAPPLGYNAPASGNDLGPSSGNIGHPFDQAYPPYTSYYDTDAPKDDEGAKGLGMASMIMGICSLGMTFLGMFFSGLCCLSFIVSIIGLALGGVSISKYRRTGAEDGKGQAIAGIIMNSIDLGIAVVGFFMAALIIGLILGTGNY